MRDQGPGIPEGMRSQVFGKFVRLQEGGNHMHSGSGLGLAFCQLVAEANEGRIWVEDNPPRGSTFVLEIPHLCATGEAAPGAAEGLIGS